jgi:acetyl-CoA C-acetyltransferase
MTGTSGIVVTGAARTPTGKFLGALADSPAPRLGAIAVRAAIERSGVSPEDVDEIFVGNVVSAGIGQAPARQCALAAGLSPSVPATAVNNVCGSGLRAVMFAAQAIRAGDGATYVAAGVESMSNAPYLLPRARLGLRAGHGQLLDANITDGLWCATEDASMGTLAEATAAEFGLHRADLDDYACLSHERAVAASRSGLLAEEIVPVPPVRESDKVVATDEPPRPDCDRTALARLKPAFSPGGCITAGNAPGLSDGAAALVLMARSSAERANRPCLARIVSWASVAVEPRLLFTAPPLAIHLARERACWQQREIDLFEVNEAFAAQILANARVLGWDRSYLQEHVNVHGGAIALGHPIGASGARILVTLVHAMRRRGARRGVAALCHGGGGAVAVAIESM